jgi:hypothetical protein
MQAVFKLQLVDNRNAAKGAGVPVLQTLSASHQSETGILKAVPAMTV